MKSFTAIYDTQAMKNIQYSFKAESMEKAIEFCKTYFTVPVKHIILDSVEADFNGKTAKEVIISHRTSEGEAIIDGKSYYFRKHWSYHGAIPVFSWDDTNTPLFFVDANNEKVVA